MVKWTLKHIRLQWWDLFDTTAPWFRKDCYLSACVRDGVRYHPGQIYKFAHEDKQESVGHSKDNKVHTRWRTTAALRLFALRKAIQDQAKEFGPVCKLLYSNDRHPMVGYFWKMFNCMPAGGVWAPDKAPAPRDPIGKPCRSVLCPWCWMRQMAYLSERLTLSTEKEITSPQGHSGPGFGFSGPLSVSAVDLWINPLKDELGILANPAALTAYVKATEQRFRALAEPVHNDFVRTISPIYRKNLSNQEEIGIRIGFVYKGSFASPTFETYDNLTVPQAMRSCSPFPIRWLEPGVSYSSILKLIGIMKNRWTYSFCSFKPEVQAAA